MCIMATNAKIAIARLFSLVVVNQVVRALTLALIDNRRIVSTILKVWNLLLVFLLLLQGQTLVKLLNINRTHRLHKR